MTVRLLNLLLLLPFICTGQDSPWQSITISEGLSQGMIYDLLEDKEGFLWFGTKDGLNRYDGYNFKVFTHDPYNEKSISGNTCTALLQDSKGRIWIGTEKDGLNLFDPQTQRFYHAAVSDKDHSDAGNYGIVFLKEDVNGTIWLLTDTPGKIFKVDSLPSFPAKTDFSNQVSSPSSGQKNAIQFLFDHHSIGFVASENFYKYSIRHPTPAETSYSTGHFKVLEDKQQRFWLVGRDSILCWKKDLIKVIRFPKAGLSSANQFPDGTIAICNQEYTWLFKPDELLLQDSLTAHNAYMKMPPNSNSVNHIFKDRSGTIWASTKGYGLLKFNPRVKLFQSYVPALSPAALFQDYKGNVYLHANYFPAYRIYQLDKKNNSIRSLPNRIGDEPISHDAIFQDRQHNFWMTFFNSPPPCRRSLVKLTEDWKISKKYPLDVRDDKNFSLKIHEDEKGIIWLGISNGIYFRFDPVTEKFTSFSYRSLLPASGSTVENFCMYQDGKTLWIGTQKGLIQVKHFQSRPNYSIYKNSSDDRLSLSNDFVSGVINDPIQPDKYLWVSTKGGGLELLDKHTGKFEHFTEARGLPNKVVYGVLVGDDGNLWMSTNRGLSSLNPKTLIFTNFNKSDGLQDDEFNTNSYFKAANGELLFGGIKGINIFRPSSMINNSKQPVVKMVGLKINNKEIEVDDESDLLPRSLGYIDALKLSHDQNQLSLEFVVMDFTNPVKNRFRYQLQGIDKDWVEAGTHHFANYAQLPPGSYTFRVMGTTNGEVWSKPAELKIRVNPPFYKTWWAYFIYFITLIYLWYRWNQSQLNRVRLQEQVLYKDKEAARLAELDAIKTNFFTNISHEFRTPLTLLTGPLAMFQKKYPEEELLATMQRNLFRLQTLINQLLDLSKLEAGNMAPRIQYDDLPVFLNYLFASFESLAQSKQIAFEKSQSHSTQLAYFDSDKLEKIVTNLLSNAFKFTPEKGRISVNVDYLNPDLMTASVRITVTDNGIGIDQQRLPRIFDRFFQGDDSHNRHFEGTGIGLALVKELVSALQGSIDVKSTPGEGSTFTVILPCNLATWANNLVPSPSKNESGQFTQESLDNGTKTSEEVSSPKEEQPILLIVEDNLDLRRFVRNIFEDSYRIEEARDGKEGLELAFNQIPDLVICDLMMPTMDGFTFCKTLKKDLRTDHIPVIMLTAKAALEDRLKGLEIGADDFIAKPFDTEELSIRVKNLLKQRQLLQQKYSSSLHQVPSEKIIPSHEQFLQKANEILEEYLADSSFNVEQFATEMGLTTVQLRRKLKAITNQTGIEYIRNYRLERAALFLKNQTGTVSEIAYQVGFESLSYFSKVFQERFEKKPSEWL